MKKLILISLLSFSFLACTNEKKSVETTKVEAVEPYKHLYGFWVGDFISENAKDSVHSVNKINIVIKSIIDNKVTGYSIVAGNKRPLVGKVDSLNNQLNFVLTEPGNDKYDGEFTFKLVNNHLIGQWNAYDQSINVTKRSFELTRKEFQYNANLMLPEHDYLDFTSGKDSSVVDSVDGQAEVYVEKYHRAASDYVYKINSSTHQFTEDEIKNYKKLDLEILRNTIFARHGYTFKKRSYRQFFDYVDWYVPVTDDVDGQLTATEKANIKLLLRFEKYASDNYDTFGR